MDVFDFRYDSTGYGWARIKMQCGEQAVDFDASYIGRNPLADLLETLAGIITENLDEGFMCWCDEPGFLKTVIDVEGDDATLTVEETGADDTNYWRIPESQWVKRIEARVNVRQMAEAVMKEAERKIRQQGLVGFSRDWYPAGAGTTADVFPVSAYLALKGINYNIDDNGVAYSDVLEEMSIINSLAEGKDEKHFA